MPATNAPTAEAATRTAPGLNRSLTLLGVFTSAEADRALVRLENGAMVMLVADVQDAGLTLLGVGDGWAMVRQDDAIHRLVIA